MRLFIASILAIALAGDAWAAPAISSISGTVSAGQTLTLSGTDFETKTTAAPIRFDTFEGGTNNTTLSSPWQNYSGGSGTQYKTGRAWGGSVSAGRNITEESFNASYITFTGRNEVFYSYWLYVDNLANGESINLKLGRISSSAASNNPYNGVGTQSLTTYTDMYPAYPDPYLAYWPDEGGEAGVNAWDHMDVPKGAWVRIDCHAKVSIPAGTSNGAAECLAMYPGQWQDGISDTTLNTRPSGSWQYTSVLLGTMDGTTGGQNYDVYIDDVYVDDTLARVEICSTNTWSTRTKCNVQPASSWSDTSVAVTINPSQFSGTAYLFAVNASGEVSPPTTITIGATYGTGAHMALGSGVMAIGSGTTTVSP